MYEGTGTINNIKIYIKSNLSEKIPISVPVCCFASINHFFPMSGTKHNKKYMFRTNHRVV